MRRTFLSGVFCALAALPGAMPCSAQNTRIEPRTPSNPAQAEREQVLRLVEMLRDAIRNDDWAEASRLASRLNSAILLSRRRASQVTPSLELNALEVVAGRDVATRNPLLARMARSAYDAGQFAKAETYAKMALEAAGHGKFDWTGDAMHFGNIILGRLALSSGDVAAAEKFLLAAGKGPSSMALDTLGPSMALVKDLLFRGRRDAVIQYLLDCRSLWSMDQGKLAEWVVLVRAGLTPDFGPNANF